MAGASGIRAGRAFVEFFAEKSPLMRGMRQIEGDLKKWGGRVSMVGASLFAGGAAVLGPMTAAVAKFTGTAGDIDDLARKSGMASGALQELSYAAGTSGTDTATLANSIRKMQQNIGEAAGGSKTMRDALNDIGLSSRELIKLSPDEQFMLIGEAISRLPTPTERTASAMKLLGRSGSEMLKLFEDGREGIESLREEYRKYVGVMDEADVAAGTKFGDTLNLMKQQLGRIVDIVGSALVPHLQAAADRIIPMTKAVIDWVNSNRQLVVQIAAVGAGLVAGGAALIGFGGALSVAGMAIGGIATAASAAAATLATVFGAVLSPIGLVTAAVIGGGYAFVTYTEMGQSALSTVSGYFTDLWGTATGAWQGIVDAVMSGDLALAGKIATQGLYVAWLKVSSPIMALWEMMTGFFQDGWDVVTSFLSTAMLSVWYGVQEGFYAVVSTILSAWTPVNNMLLASLDLIESITGETAVGKTARRALAAVDETVGGMRAGADKRQAEIERDRLAATAIVEEDRNRRINAREDARAARENSRMSEILRAQEEIAQLQRNAADQRAAADALVLEKITDGDEDENDFTSESIRRTSLAVTNSFAASRVGGAVTGFDKLESAVKDGNTYLQQIASNTEAADTYTD